MPDAIYKGQIDTYYGGMSDDVRDQDLTRFALSSHFDIFSKPKRLVPFPKMVDDTFAGGRIVLFESASAVGTPVEAFYGLGVAAGTDKVGIFAKNTPSGSWSLVAASAGGVRNRALFRHYNDFLYFGEVANISAYGPLSGVPVFVEPAYAPAGSGPTCQGLVTSDDFFLVPIAMDNILSQYGIAKKNGGTLATDNWTTPLTLPKNRRPVDICEVGDIVAIACPPSTINYNRGSSKVYIWDKVNSDIAQTVDWGEDYLSLVGEIEGQLIGVSIGGGVTAALSNRIVIRGWQGGTKAAVIQEIQFDDGVTVSIDTNGSKFMDRNKMVFGFGAKIDGVTYRQFASIGRKSVGYPIAFSLDRKVNNDTAITTLNGAAKFGDYVLASHGAFNSEVNVRTGGTDDGSVTSEYKSQKLDGSKEAGPDAARKNKVLTMVGLVCDTLPTGGTISVYVKTDRDSSYRLVKTYNTASGVGDEWGKLADDTDFDACKNWQFYATSNFGAQPVHIIYAWKYAGDPVDSD